MQLMSCNVYSNEAISAVSTRPEHRAHATINPSTCHFLEVSSIAPMEALSLKLPMRAPFLRQGGGLLINGGNVVLTSCSIFWNTADDGSRNLP